MIKRITYLFIVFSLIISLVAFGEDNAWKKVNGNFISSDGSIIKGALKKGIDVSEWQKKIDWKIVKESDIEFAILRCGYGQDIEEQDDKYFTYNADMCTELDIPFGVYIYSYATTVEAAKSEAKHVLRLVKDYDLTYPIYYDMEDKMQTVLDAKLLGDIAETFCDIIMDEGYEVGIYSNLNTFKTALWDIRFSNPKWQKWVAHYAAKCEYKGDYSMWQCTDKGKIDGLNGDFDINFFYGKVDEGEQASSWAIPYVNKAIANGLLPKEFRNNYQEKISRLEFCKLAYNLLDVKDKIGKKTIKNPFKDTDSKEIIALYQLGIINGKSSTEFYPDDKITREELSKVLSNLLSICDRKAHQDIIYKYNDSEKISDWAIEPVNTMYIFDVMRGDNNNKFCPKDNTTKEEAIITIYNAFAVI